MLTIFTLRSTDDLWPNTSESHNPRNRVGWHRIRLGAQRYVRSMAQRRQLRLAEQQLASLDDRMLKDIGIGRSEISYVVRYGRDR